MLFSDKDSSDEGGSVIRDLRRLFSTSTASAKSPTGTVDTVTTISSV